MGSHYDTLGVEQGSTTQEIRKAYLRRARALHPDRQQGRSPDEARRAEKAMQQVNVAWNVLSDPKKKSEYDSGLNPRRTSSSTQRTTQRPPKPQPPRPTAPRAATSAPRQESRTFDEEPGDGSISVWASMPVLLVLGLLLGILIVTAFAGDQTDIEPRAPQSAQLDVGDCFALVGNVPRERSCASGTSDGQVVEIGPEPGNCPESTQSLLDPNTDFFLCWARMIPGSSNTVPNE